MATPLYTPWGDRQMLLIRYWAHSLPPPPPPGPCTQIYVNVLAANLAFWAHTTHSFFLGVGGGRTQFLLRGQYRSACETFWSQCYPYLLTWDLHDFRICFSMSCVKLSFIYSRRYFSSSYSFFPSPNAFFRPSSVCFVMYTNCSISNALFYSFFY